MYSNGYMKSTQPCNDNKAQNQRVYLDLIFVTSTKVSNKNVMEQRLFILFFSFSFWFSFLQFGTWTLNIIIFEIDSSSAYSTGITFNEKWMLSNYPSTRWTKKSYFFQFCTYYCTHVWRKKKIDFFIILLVTSLIIIIHTSNEASAHNRYGCTLFNRVRKKNHITKLVTDKNNS